MEEVATAAGSKDRGGRNGSEGCGKTAQDWGDSLGLLRSCKPSAGDCKMRDGGRREIVLIITNNMILGSRTLSTPLQETRSS